MDAGRHSMKKKKAMAMDIHAKSSGVPNWVWIMLVVIVVAIGAHKMGAMQWVQGKIREMRGSGSAPVVEMMVPEPPVDAMQTSVGSGMSNIIGR